MLIRPTMISNASVDNIPNNVTVLIIVCVPSSVCTERTADPWTTLSRSHDSPGRKSTTILPVPMLALSVECGRSACRKSSKLNWAKKLKPISSGAQALWTSITSIRNADRNENQYSEGSVHPWVGSWEGRFVRHPHFWCTRYTVYITDLRSRSGSTKIQYDSERFVLLPSIY